MKELSTSVSSRASVAPQPDVDALSSSWLTRWLASQRHEDMLITVAGLLLAGGVMILPLWLVTRYADQTAAAGVVVGGVGAGGAGVGIAAILRTVSRDVLRTSMGVASRTVSRAYLRHWTHVIVDWLSTSVIKRTRARTDGIPHPGIAIAVGSIALALSYGIVITLLAPSTREALFGAAPLWLAGATAAVPLLCYYGIAYLAGRALDVRVVPRTEVDGLLIQLYFTFALSYLPLTSEADYRGDPGRRAAVAMSTLLGMLALHLGVAFIGQAYGSPLLDQLSVLFLIHAFVLAFPFDPLDGKHIWKSSKLLWLVTLAPIAWAFHTRIPRVFYELL